MAEHGPSEEEAFTMPSDEAMAHLAMLLQHRPDQTRLAVEVSPRRCSLCQEIATWFENFTEPVPRSDLDRWRSSSPDREGAE